MFDSPNLWPILRKFAARINPTVLTKRSAHRRVGPAYASLREGISSIARRVRAMRAKLSPLGDAILMDREVFEEALRWLISTAAPLCESLWCRSRSAARRAILAGGANSQLYWQTASARTRSVAKRWKSRGLRLISVLSKLLCTVSAARPPAPCLRAESLGRIGAVLSMAALLGALSTANAYSTRNLAHPDTLAAREVPLSTKLYDRKGRLLYEFFDPQVGKRTLVPLNQISPHLINATIATEDSTFYLNPGVNLRGIARAAWRNLTSDEVQGGSSITQQLIKNVVLSDEERSRRTISTKIKEALLAIEVTRRYPKDLILQWYLNEIYYGNLSYGIEAASQSYFGKKAQELSLAEAALLAGLPQAPAYYSPFTNYATAMERQKAVLDLMVRNGYITQEQAAAAQAEELNLAPQEFPIQAPHFVMYVRDQLEKKYGPRALYRGGLEVTTTLDLDVQRLAESAVTTHMEGLRRQNASNAALVALDPRRGEVLAMVGSASFFDRESQGQVNMTTANRQPGSTFKPFTYVTAFAKGYTPATMLLDVPTSFQDGANPRYVPQNVDFRFRGPVAVRQALAQSLNVPAVRTMAFAGVDDVIATAHAMGITTLTERNTYGLSLTLGAGEVKPLDMAFAYSVFANGGKMAGRPVPGEERRPGMRGLEPVSVLKVKDKEGKILEEGGPPSQREVLSPQLAYLVTDILSDNQARAPMFGLNSPLNLQDRPAAVKTGTTTDWRDTWTIGYTNELVAAVWVGNADGRPMDRVLSTSTATPIWHDFMEATLKDTPPSSFQMPPGVVDAAVCTPSGLLPTPRCRQTATEIFVAGTVPTQYDNLYQGVSSQPVAPGTRVKGKGKRHDD